MLDAKAKLIKNQAVGVNDKVDAILNSTDVYLIDLYNKASVLNKSQLKKSYVEASLLCESDLVKISKIIDVPVAVLGVYKEFFFDITGFDKLSKIEHIEGVEDDTERSLKLWALGQGMTFISWRLGDKVSLSPIDGLVEMFSTCMYKAKESVYSSNTSDSSKEAIKWTKMSTDIARLLKIWVMDSSAARADLAIAIQEVCPSFIGLDELLEENKNA
jgi:hypothetical protein